MVAAWVEALGRSVVAEAVGLVSGRLLLCWRTFVLCWKRYLLDRRSSDLANGDDVELNSACRSSLPFWA